MALFVRLGNSAGIFRTLNRPLFWRPTTCGQCLTHSNARTTLQWHAKRGIQSTIGISSQRKYEVFSFHSDGKYQKETWKVSDMLKNRNITARDLLVIDSGRRSRPQPSIISRGDYFIFTMTHLKAIVTADWMVLFDANTPMVQESAKMLSDFIQDTDYHFRQGADDWITVDEDGNYVICPAPFECKILEGLLDDVSQRYRARVQLFRPLIESFLFRLTREKVNNTQLHMLLPLKDAISMFDGEVRNIMECVKQLLESEQDMADLMLSERKKQRLKSHERLPSNYHEQIELLLEGGYRQLGETFEVLKLLQNRVQITQELVEISLDSHRNDLMTVNVHLALTGVILGSMTTIAQFFGMNVPLPYEESQWTFPFLLGTSTTASIICWLWVVRYIGYVRIRKLFCALVNVESVHKELSGLGRLNKTNTKVESASNLRAVLDHIDVIETSLSMARSAGKASAHEVKADLTQYLKEWNLTEEEFDSIIQTFEAIQRKSEMQLKKQ